MNRMLPREWYELAEACGGVEGLAARVGVSAGTIYRWAHGMCNARKPARTVVDGIAREMKLAQPFKGA